MLSPGVIGYRSAERVAWRWCFLLLFRCFGFGVSFSYCTAVLLAFLAPRRLAETFSGGVQAEARTHNIPGGDAPFFLLERGGNGSHAGRGLAPPIFFCGMVNYLHPVWKE